jgi:cobalt-zinc-cadmium efflux system membrane fusion protein
VKRHALRDVVTAPARVVYDADAVAQVGSLVSGRVVEVEARLGDSVRKWDELLVIEAPELGQAQSEHLQRRAEVGVAIAAVDPARRAYERAKGLFEQSQGIALGEVQKREAELKAAEGAVLAAKSAALASRNRLALLGMEDDAVKVLEDRGTLNSRLPVRAPMDGQVIERAVTLGELVFPEKAKLLVLADTSKVWVVANVAEADLGAVTLGAAARVLIGNGEEAHEGKVTYVGPSLDADTRTAWVRIELAAHQNKLRPGTFARASIETAAAREALAVPAEAVLTVEGSAAVFVPVKGEEHTFAPRPVKVAEAVGGLVPIESGLTEGEPVVVGGAFILKADLGKAGAEGHQH